VLETATAAPPDAGEVVQQAARRRVVAVISHPDAGKSTLTEALLLHARAIGRAGATHGKAGRKATVSDWMSMEQQRGISISSAAMQFEHDGVVVNLVDTPGHADFSEDTYRVLAAVDSVIMLVDAAKGLETQTMKLFDVCRRRKLPVITMINKWDRPGLDALDLMDEIETRTGLVPTPLTWPVGVAGDFAGLVDRRTGQLARFTRTAGGATIAEEHLVEPEGAEALVGPRWAAAQDEVALLESHDQELFLAAATTPVLFGAAVLNIGIGRLLDVIVEHGPAAEARRDTAGQARPVDEPFSGFVFKVQSGMNAAHRDRIAFIRVCSGVFERGMTLTHQPTGRPFATKYAHQFFGRERETVDLAWPGDVVGLVNANALRPGDTLYLDHAVEFPPIPRFAPEHFQVVNARDTSKHKQFHKGLSQLDREGVIQLLTSQLRGPQQPILGAVGQMQYEVVADRMTHEFNCPVSLEPTSNPAFASGGPMATVYGLHEIELRPEVDPEEYEQWFADEVVDQQLLPGWKAALLRADRGPRAGKYLMVFEVESEEARDQYFPAEGQQSEEFVRYLAEHPEIAALWERAQSYEAEDVTTDYVVVAS
jgi:peptide chain release factor 3